MGFSIHNIAMPSGAGPQILDRLAFASVLNLPYPARSAQNVGATGAVTAGSGYTFSPTLTPTGGVVQAASGAGVAPVVGLGWQALFRPVMKVVSAAVASGGGGSGVVTNDTFLFANGIELTATASAGVVTAWAVTQAGAFAQPGGLPSSMVPISTSGVGVGVVVTPSWGIGSVSVDDSGNYSTLPTGITVTSVDGNGSGGAVGAPVATGSANGASQFRAVFAGAQPAQPALSVATDFPAPNYGFIGMVNNSTEDVTVVSKQFGYVVVAITPSSATGNVVAGTLDAILWA